MSALDQITEAREAYETAVIVLGESVLKEILNPLFEQFPTLEFIRWNQYTPFFNDGDPCTFSVHGVHSWSFSDNDEIVDEEEDYFYPSEFETDYPGFSAAMRRIEFLLTSNEKILYSLFDDHAQVIAYRNGEVVADEYVDHN
jgi:hypothetical protein